MPLLENLRSENVSKLTLREPVVLQTDVTVRMAIEQMRRKKVGCAIIVDQDAKPVGVFTESMVTQMLSEIPSQLDDPVWDHLADQFPWVKLTDPVEDVLSALELKNVRFLCVVDENGRTAALTGQKGLMEYIAEHFPQQITVQRIGGSPFPRDREGA